MDDFDFVMDTFETLVLGHSTFGEELGHTIGHAVQRCAKLCPTVRDRV